MSIEIGSASELNVDMASVAFFYQSNWTRRIALSNEKFYEWQFSNTPNKLGDQCCLALKSGEIVAVMGLTERPFFLKGEEKKGVELTTWIVKESSRNLGLGPKMLDYLKSKYNVMFGMGISEQALPVYLRMGFKYLKSIPRFVKVLNHDVVKKFGHSTPLVNKLSKIKVKNEKYTIFDASKEVVDDIFNDFSISNNLFLRNYDWIKWRYIEHPSFSYNVKIIGNEKHGKCIVIYRIDIIEELKIMHCVDLFGDKKTCLSAISFLEDEGASLGVDVIDFYSTNSGVNSLFIYKNWLSVLDCDFFDFPHLFHPIELRTPSTTSLIMWSNDDSPYLYEMGNLYITKQDCDFDRPVMENL
ncbi:GNAT family N-acetyltransferase [uncultured Shewanella sp.]|uniref:GNAT family N-acetyltransferase n=1 Tax=uncultured Shewanella sp. TaxID=173975 RepID=UPI00262B0F9D|nr:GNAT family N-acetyltransferase [uncultured Shewanella sp.]